MSKPLLGATSVAPGSMAASDIAHVAHMGQIDRDGQPHIAHVRRVVEMVPDDCKAVAWLHDVLEDSAWTPEELFARGHDTQTCYAVLELTRKEGEVYNDYIRRVRDRKGEIGRIAFRVKEADIIDNLGRCLQSQDAAAVRYRQALRILWGADA